MTADARLPKFGAIGGKKEFNSVCDEKIIRVIRVSDRVAWITQNERLGEHKPAQTAEYGRKKQEKGSHDSTRF